MSALLRRVGAFVQQVEHLQLLNEVVERHGTFLRLADRLYYQRFFLGMRGGAAAVPTAVASAGWSTAQSELKALAILFGATSLATRASFCDSLFSAAIGIGHRVLFLLDVLVEQLSENRVVVVVETVTTVTLGSAALTGRETGAVQLKAHRSFTRAADLVYIRRLPAVQGTAELVFTLHRRNIVGWDIIRIHS